MLDLAVIVLRGVQYAALSILVGLPVFMVYNRTALEGLDLPWPRPLMIAAAGILTLAAPAALLAQTALMAGSTAAALDPEALRFVAAGTPLGLALVARAGLALAILVACVALRPGRWVWMAALILGLAAAATFGWTGHAGATEGAMAWPHRASTVIHAAAASAWLGALAVFVILAARPVRDQARDAALTATLRRFSGLGAVMVALLVATGVANGLFIVGWSNATAAAGTAWGLLLACKLGLFAAMVGLAAWHRFRAVPALDRNGASEWARLRLSLGLEFFAGGLILALVAILGVQPPLGG
ncbi:copper homeostasis membrane protein CopD [Brevundimonas sp. S30B]|jgi:copper resistance protein D|uniref:copper homeostasis membrane protein CopD n=1 Tax=unclassified Brevundimonas TaxID=2622653 RepID=UPI0010725F03|nr:MULTISPECIES: copper homeostasis membrane protein CopD [unclassified Brevundimonas]QBX37866.1 copper homeostasis membrane protein CopD [Brevundimonas sp. MF30-B]TFW02778.1 copper homeostasis membrane protein CopD [Brevundimonas sp. S30B]